MLFKLCRSFSKQSKEVLNYSAYKKDAMVLGFDKSNRFLALVPRTESNKDIEVSENYKGEIKKQKIGVWHRTCVLII